jgi:hypothetical protein
MNRRTALHGVASAVGLSLAGCLGVSPPTREQLPDEDGRELEHVPDVEKLDRQSNGKLDPGASSPHPHRLVFVNERTQSVRGVTRTLAERERGRLFYSGDGGILPATSFSIYQLTEEGDYRFAVERAGHAAVSVQIPRQWFFVEHSVTVVGFTPDGTVAETGVNEQLYTEAWTSVESSNE